MMVYQLTKNKKLIKIIKLMSTKPKLNPNKNPKIQTNKPNPNNPNNHPHLHLPIKNKCPPNKQNKNSINSPLKK
jgi:hypothetical protein